MDQTTFNTSHGEITLTFPYPLQPHYRTRLGNTVYYWISLRDAMHYIECEGELLIAIAD